MNLVFDTTVELVGSRRPIYLICLAARAPNALHLAILATFFNGLLGKPHCFSIGGFDGVVMRTLHKNGTPHRTGWCSSPAERLVANASGLGAFFAETLLLVLFILGVVAVEEGPLRVAFRRQDVGGNAVEEPAVV